MNRKENTAQWLPECFSYLNDPITPDSDNMITIAQVKSIQPQGQRVFFPVLIPFKKTDEVLSTTAEPDYDIRCNYPDTSPNYEVRPYSFYARNPSNQAEKFETLVDGWHGSNNFTLIPNSTFLMRYNLSSRVVESSNKVIWDNIEKPQPNIVENIASATYESQLWTEAYVKIDKDYLEDYALRRACSIVSYYYEDRILPLDNYYSDLLRNKEYREIQQAGRKFVIKKIGKKVSLRIWGCKLILKPYKSLFDPLEDNYALTWPDFEEPIDLENSNEFMKIKFVYVKDEALKKFENDETYNVEPYSGSISYKNQWSTGRSRRYGRDFIEYSLKDLYHGCHPDITKHINKYAVKKEIADKNFDEFENDNITTKTERLINAFFNLCSRLETLSYKVNKNTSDNTVCSIDKIELQHNGWWSIEELRKLAYVATKEMPKEEFIRRCKNLYILFEHLKEKTLRNLLISIGFDKKNISDYRSLKLLQLIIQTCEAAESSGLDITSECSELTNRISDLNKQVDNFEYFFALNTIRQIESHLKGNEKDKEFITALETFGISHSEAKSEYGYALDEVYISITKALDNIATKIQNSLEK